jgi:predicted amidohydrolase
MAGNSMLVDPSGKVIACGGENECVVSAEIDLSDVKKARENFPALSDRVFR